MKGTLISILFLFLLSCQDVSDSPVAVISPVVERIINESVLAFQQVPSEEVRSLQILDFAAIDKTSAPYILAKSKLKVSNDQPNRFGISSPSEVKVFIDGKFVYHFIPEDSFHFSEMAYGIFSFNAAFEAGKIKDGSEIVLLSKADQAEKIYFSPISHPSEKATVSFGSWFYALGHDALSGLSSSDELFWHSFPAKMQSSFVKHDEMVYQRESYCEWTYPNGIMQMALLNLYELTQEQYLLDYVKSVNDFTLENRELLRHEYNNNAIRCANYRMFRKSMLDDAGAPTLGMKELHRITKDDQYLPVIKEMVYFVLYEQERLADGTFSRQEPYENTVWADDLFMGVQLMLLVARETNDMSIFDECVLQIRNMHSYLWDSENELHRHGYIGSKQAQSPVCWSRANGWLIWTISDALMKLPKEHAGYGEIMDIYQKSIDGIVARQSPGGLWNQILTNKASFQETSSSAMFTLAIARGIVNGWLPDSYVRYANLGWKGVSGKINDGVVYDICRGTGIGFDEDFYFSRDRFPNDPRGLGAVIVCAIEMEKLRQALDRRSSIF